MKHDSGVHNKCQYTNLGMHFIHYLLYTEDDTGDKKDLKKKSSQKFLAQHTSEVYYSVLRAINGKL